ncbi:uncharacterized protein LOC143566083 [Bidens hawaiensis]|uniref:uncharacterized protein LOC143566083 n=1 Tax=Bidens hawaiensis TaxID=980011 RepID=UPI00404A832B
MTCLGIRYAGDCLRHLPASVSSPNNFHSVPKLAVKSRFPATRAAATAAASVVSDLSISRSDSSAFESFVDDEEYESLSVSDKIDEWMRNSVTEIVKNIRQAPLLVQVYANGVVKTEKAVSAADWPNERLTSADGVILVEELQDKVDLDDDYGEGTKAFGVVIQGRFKGRDRCKSACYLLKTCSVNGGMGRFCTHFCLMKVRSFSKSAASQLNECWLLP